MPWSNQINNFTALLTIYFNNHEERQDYFKVVSRYGLRTHIVNMSQFNWAHDLCKAFVYIQ